MVIIIRIYSENPIDSADKKVEAVCLLAPSPPEFANPTGLEITHNISSPGLQL